MTSSSSTTTAADVFEMIERKKELPTIVEGKRDRAALKALGFTDIHELDAALFHVVERFGKGARIQILTDLDSEGKKLYRKLSSDLRQRGVFIDDELRELLFKTQLRQIEGLVSYLNKQ